MSTPFCPQCGKQFAPEARFCSACGAVALPAPMVAARARLVRPRSPRMIAGVCSGLSVCYGWDLALVRILFAVSVCLTSGIGLLAYIAAWIFIPDAPYALPATVQSYGPPTVI